MTEETSAPEEALPFVAPCREIAATAPFAWLRRGWTDMWSAPRQSLTYGTIVVLHAREGGSEDNLLLVDVPVTAFNGQVGDVMIPNVVYDEHSRNTFLFKNCFVANDIAPYLTHGSVFDNQKAVTVRGTFLQNNDFVGVFYREGYTDIEMETGPYLSGVYENIYPKRYPVNEIVNLFINAPYDIGVLHYASDTPYSRRQTLLSKSLSYFGVAATYAAAIAIVRRILEQEVAWLRGRQ